MENITAYSLNFFVEEYFHYIINFDKKITSTFKLNMAKNVFPIQLKSMNESSKYLNYEF